MHHTHTQAKASSFLFLGGFSVASRHSHKGKGGYEKDKKMAFFFANISYLYITHNSIHA